MSELSGKLIVSLMAFGLIAAALISGAVQRIELSIILVFLSYVVVSTALALRAMQKQKFAAIGIHLERLAARLSGQIDEGVGPWGIRYPSPNAPALAKRDSAQ